MKPTHTTRTSKRVISQLFKATHFMIAATGTSLALLGTAVGQTELAKQLSDAVPPGTTLVVAEQSDQFSIPWRLSKVGEDAPYSIRFANFNGGPAVLEALVAGAVDVGFVGEAPLPLALSAGVTSIRAIATIANPGSPGNIFLVVQPDRGISSVEQLRGKSVAYPPGTGRHMILSGLLHAAGLNINADIKGVQLAGSEVAPTFASGAVDSAIVLGQQYFRLGEPPIIGDGTGHNWGLSVLVTRDDVLANPAKAAALADLVRRAVAVNNWQIQNPQAWIQATYVKQQGLSLPQGQFLFDKSGLGAYYPLSDEMSTIFQSIADGLYETGALKSKITLAPYLDDRFNHIVATQNQNDQRVAPVLKNDQHRFVNTSGPATPTHQTQ